MEHETSATLYRDESTYHMASTRMNPRRMEAEVVRDNLFYVNGDLDAAMGGPDIDNNLGLKSKRRSIYLWQAAEKEVEFLRIFDGPSVTECYTRWPTVVPQQALAMANSELTLNEPKSLAKKLSGESGDNAEAFARHACTGGTRGRVVQSQRFRNRALICGLKLTGDFLKERSRLERALSG